MLRYSRLRGKSAAMTTESTLEEKIGAILQAKGYTLATAESCSGGLIAHRITNVAGSSSYFLGGIVSYSNDAKTRLLGVDADMISTHGAVSEEVAEAMARGARDQFSADVTVGVTGIAGPGGGTREKPVGHVCIAVTGPAGTVVETCHFDGDREAVKDRTSEKALTMILEQIG
ncbi:MAG: CinA family protein [Candidatus Hydrogenedentes bacterium]|nr:CinA family protein [Candidatus Hydrogenedentota bacterium]